MVPERIKRKAEQVLKAYRSGRVRPRKTMKNKSRSLKVDHRWRLINRGNGWKLVSHEEYNHLINR